MSKIRTKYLKTGHVPIPDIYCLRFSGLIVLCHYSGPPPGWFGNPPPSGTEIFVGRIPRDFILEDLIPIFERIGQIYEFRLLMDFSRSNRGFGFVRYTTPEDAEQAVRILDNFKIG